MYRNDNVESLMAKLRSINERIRNVEVACEAMKEPPSKVNPGWVIQKSVTTKIKLFNFLNLGQNTKHREVYLDKELQFESELYVVFNKTIGNLKEKRREIELELSKELAKDIEDE